jgi:DNA-3-methyladenine glycosylase II
MEIKSNDILKFIVKLEPKFQRVFDQVGYLDLQSFKRDPYVSIVGAIVGQKMKYVEAKKIRGNLFTRFGTKFTPHDLETAINDLPRMGLSRDNILAIQSLNNYLIQNEIKTLGKIDMSIAKHCSGIGPWTIQTAQLVCDPTSDIFPCGDLFLQNRIKRLFELTRKPTQSQVETMSKKWAPYRGVITWYLWKWF